MRILLLIALLAASAIAQTAAPPATKPSEPPPQDSQPAQDPHNQVIAHASTHPESGSVTDGTFTSDFFRFSFKLPDGFTAQDRPTIQADNEKGHAKLHGDDPASQQQLQDFEDHAYVLLSAEGHLPKQKGLSQVMIGAEELPEDITTAEDYAKYSETDPILSQLQFKPLNEPTPLTIAGRPFVRKEYTANAHVVGTDVTAAYAEYVTVAQGYAIVVSFWSDNEADLRALEKQIDTLKFSKE